MDWESQRRERQRELEKERKRLLSINDIDAEKLSIPDKYQRIRYLREIEADEWLQKVKIEVSMKTGDPVQRYSKSTKVYFKEKL